MGSEAIRYFHRYRGQLETEEIYGEAYLRWNYETPLGRLALWALIKRAWFSRWYGWRMDRPVSRQKIAPFIEQYQVDPEEFTISPESFGSFNEFFYRTLKSEARPICEAFQDVGFPADGRHFGFPNVSKVDGIFIKGQMFHLDSLLQDDRLAARYRDGVMVLSRLCPVDYHRFHFPVAGRTSVPRLINGWLYSVNPIALKQNIHIFTENKRMVTTVTSPACGLVTMIEVGATCVGGMTYTFPSGEWVEKGDEKGFFKFGGSSTVTLFEPGSIQLADDLVQQTSQRVELYARMGDTMGRVLG